MGLRVIEGDFPGLATDVEWTPACLPLQPNEPGRALGWEVGDVIIGIGGMQFGCIISVLRPGGRDRQIILLEDVLPVPQAHGAGILRDGKDGVPEEHLAPGIRHKLILH